ncbi:hypothetical protein DSM43518_01292 [Mycobacterium marinum]|nr:hypothetical protein MM1218R_00554 [Mycobacterium marinum]RFZ08239.1 hypothetical protein DE4381_02455 [Mycobacterium marinum]RFZ13438.1 hypothetical protein DSM43518_01292 [Mycobacterium marinum]CDM74692.1 hypothetical protein MMARE11_05440 [Mycobacterium marinum E11]
MEPPGVGQRELNCALSPTSDPLTVHVTSTRFLEPLRKKVFRRMARIFAIDPCAAGR